MASSTIDTNAPASGQRRIASGTIRRNAMTMMTAIRMRSPDSTRTSVDDGRTIGGERRRSASRGPRGRCVDAPTTLVRGVRAAVRSHLDGTDSTLSAVYFVATFGPAEHREREG